MSPVTEIRLMVARELRRSVRSVKGIIIGILTLLGAFVASLACVWMEGNDRDAAKITSTDAYIEIKKAAIDDGKNVNDHPNVDVPGDHPGHLHKALELLRKVHADVAREEDDPATKGLRDRAVGHIDGAIHATERAIRDVKPGH